MDNFVYPKKTDLVHFVDVIKENKFSIIKYLPHIDQEWYRIISECVEYVEHTAQYKPCKRIEDAAARLLYKVAKRHELGDGNR